MSLNSINRLMIIIIVTGCPSFEVRTECLKIVKTRFSLKRLKTVLLQNFELVGFFQYQWHWIKKYVLMKYNI